MKRKNVVRLTLICLSIMLPGIWSARTVFSRSQSADESIATQAFAIIQSQCLPCHGEEKMSGLDLRQRDAALKGGFNGAAIIPGNSAESRLYKMLTGEMKPRMPLGSALSAEQISILRNWIDRGANWVEPNAERRTPNAEFPKSWAFKKPVRPAIPSVQNKAWVRNPIDAFILARLEATGLTPAPPADKRTLIRRVTFDLTGLPPTPEEISAFLRDASPDAYEKIVQRLLASPRYGERQAQHWLDVVRFAETNGYELDAERQQAWRYRDYVIRAFNDDKPYNRFILEQLAGDELEPENFEAHVATGFLRGGPQHVVAGNQDEKLNRQEWLTEAMLGTSAAFLGMTVGCARCHNHKFDPILQADFYSLQAFFAAADNSDYTNHSPADTEKYQNALKAHQEKLKPIKDALKEIEKPYEERIASEKRKLLEPKYRDALDIPKDKRTAEQITLAKDAERMLDVKYEELLEVLPADVRERRAALRRQMHALEFEAPQPLPKALAISDKLVPIPAMHILKGGDVHSPLREVQPQFLSVLLPPDATDSATITPVEIRQPDGKVLISSGRRLALAKWLASPDHPLTSRVMMNRLWQQHFGRGLVATPNDFGRNGAGVTHPELLDWLAVELMSHQPSAGKSQAMTRRDGEFKTSNSKIETRNFNRLPATNNWQIKRLHFLIVTSNAYRQSSVSDAAKAKIDPDNKLLWRQNRQRLDAEAIRDSLLAANGTLTEQMGGPPIRVPIEQEVYDTIFTEYEPDNLWPVTPDVKQHSRRSLYLFRKRNVKLPMLVAFDQPDLMSSCGARAVSVHALQSLTMLNSDFMQQQARYLAERLFDEINPQRSLLNERKMIVRLYALTLGRLPRSDELKLTTEFLRQHRAIISQRIKQGEEVFRLSKPGLSKNAATEAAWIDLCLATLNLNEFIYVK